MRWWQELCLILGELRDQGVDVKHMQDAGVFAPADGDLRHLGERLKQKQISEKRPDRIHLERLRV